MQTQHWQYLQFVDYPSLVNWSTRYLIGRESGYNKSYPAKPLSDFLTKSREVVTIEDDIEYKRVTVKIKGGGVLLRDKETGKNIGTKHQFLARSGQFIISKIDARNGAMGIIPTELDEAIVTNDFPLFDIDTTMVHPDYLRLITTTEAFIKIAHSSSSGTTNRQRVDVNNLLLHQVPLPSLKEQEKLVAAYNKKIEEAAQLSLEASDLENDIENYLYSSLSISSNNKIKNTPSLRFVDFATVTRWDYSYLAGKTNAFKTIYPVVKFEDIVKDINQDEEGNSLRIMSTNFPDKIFHYIGMESIEKNTGILIDLPKVKGQEIKSQTLLVPKSFFIYGKLRPYLNKYWYNNSNSEDIICSSEFFVFSVNSAVENEYFMYVLRSKIVQDQINDKTSGARMPRINEKIFMDVTIPLPSKIIQKKIAADLGLKESRIKIYRETSESLKRQAQQDFEQAIFK